MLLNIYEDRKLISVRFVGYVCIVRSLETLFRLVNVVGTLGHSATQWNPMRFKLNHQIMARMGIG